MKDSMTPRPQAPSCPTHGGTGPLSMRPTVQAMPDGRTSDMPRALQVQESGTVRCPRCTGRVPVTVADGYGLATCTLRRAGKACRQKFAVFGFGALTLVLPISGEEFDALSDGEADTLSAARRLGIVDVCLMPAA